MKGTNFPWLYLKRTKGPHLKLETVHDLNIPQQCPGQTECVNSYGVRAITYRRWEPLAEPREVFQRVPIQTITGFSVTGKCAVAQSITWRCAQVLRPCRASYQLGIRNGWCVTAVTGDVQAFAGLWYWPTRLYTRYPLSNILHIVRTRVVLLHVGEPVWEEFQRQVPVKKCGFSELEHDSWGRKKWDGKKQKNDPKKTYTLFSFQASCASKSGMGKLRMDNSSSSSWLPALDQPFIFSASTSLRYMALSTLIFLGFPWYSSVSMPLLVFTRVLHQVSHASVLTKYSHP